MGTLPLFSRRRLAAPVTAGTRLRGGSANTARGASRFAAQTADTARSAGCTGILVARMDSVYYNTAGIGAVGRGVLPGHT
jgi:hypothetical protein